MITEFANEDNQINVIDWEYAKIGDPAHDLAITTRGAKRPFGQANGRGRLLEAYREAGGQDVALHELVSHELMLIMHWLWETIQSWESGDCRGHAPDVYESRLVRLLRQAKDG